VLIDAGRSSPPVFLPVHVTSRDSDVYRLTSASRRPGDIVNRLVAIDVARPSLPVTYRVIRDAMTSRAFDVSQSGVMTLTSHATSLLRAVTRVNVTVEATLIGSSRTASTLVQFELVDDVGGLAWECDDERTATVTENSSRATSVATLTAGGSVNHVSYQIISGDTQHAFSIDQTTVSLSVCQSVCHSCTCTSL